MSSYVQHKYRLPYRVTVRDNDVSFVGDSCFRRLRFSELAASGSFSLVLYLAPDQRFLTKELFDSSHDPIAEEKAGERMLLDRLVKADAPFLGPPDASVVITVFSDFECPFCKKQAAILRESVAPSQPDVRIVFRQLPLPIHPWSHKAAEIAACASKQGNDAFWSIHDFLFLHQNQLRADNLVNEAEKFAQSVNWIQSDELVNCIQKNAASTAIDADVAFAHDTGINGTPTLFVNSFRIDGVASAEQLKTLVRQLKDRRNSESHVLSRTQ